MSKRVEERALEAYPEVVRSNYGDTQEEYYNYLMDVVVQNLRRMLFQEGYESAEKDLALTWKDMKRISRILDIMVEDDFKGEIPEEWGEEEYYEEVLRRFNKAKEE